MGLAPGTLYNKLNNDEGCSHHKLTLQDFIAILGITGDTAALQGLAGLFDHAVFPLPQMEQMGDDALLDMVNQVYVQGGRAHTVMAEALADGQVYIEIGKDRFPARKTNQFETGGILCRLEIIKDGQPEIIFSLSGSQPLMLTLPAGEQA